MDLSDEEKALQQKAYDYIVEHRDELIERFITSKKPMPLGFITIFMAGSPGAGKTEFSRRYVPLLIDKNDKSIQEFCAKQNVNLDGFESMMVIIDVDEIRSFLPQYTKTDAAAGSKGNAHVIQRAANKGLDILRAFCLKNGISFLLDGTFGNFDTMRELVKKSLTTGREVHVYYIYIDPLSAWNFTKAREALEGRNIIKGKFIEQYFMSRENVDKVKAEFGDAIKLTVIIKDAANRVIETKFNVPSLDQYLKTQYNNGILREYSHEDLQALIN